MPLYRLAAPTLAAVWMLAAPVRAQEAGVEPSPAPPAASPAPAAVADEAELPAEEITEEFTLGTLPTLAGPARHGMAFRVTHRFGRDLGAGGLGDLAGDLFGLDSGAQVGLELRFGLGERTQAGVYRTSDRTLELFAQHRLLDAAGRRFGAALRASVDGFDNFHEEHAPALALVVRADAGRRASLYVEPVWVARVALPEGVEGTEKDWMLLVGLGARLRANDSLSAFAEWTPRLAGFEPTGGHEGLVSFGIEKQVGGHAFQLNVSNDIASTTGQRALGRLVAGGWFLGFNLSRTFY